MKLLVVEDDPVTATFLKRGLQQAQFVVDIAADAETADEAIALCQYDAIVLDVVLPGGDGLSCAGAGGQAGSSRRSYSCQGAKRLPTESWG